MTDAVAERLQLAHRLGEVLASDGSGGKSVAQAMAPEPPKLETARAYMSFAIYGL
jgi:hypothetical protein